MKMNIEIDDDMFDTMMLNRLKRDLEMVRNDLSRGAHRDDVRWMIPVRNALEIVISLYYGSADDIQIEGE